MKKVHYAWGAVGAVPAIGVMAIPAIAAAPQAPAATARATTPAAKTVSLRHTSAPARLTAAFASTSASYASTSVNTAGGCTGNTVATKSNVSTKLKFWHTFHPAYDTSCIGTVETAFSQNVSSDRVRIYAHHLDGTKYKAYSHKAGGYGHAFTVGVHRSFGYPPIQVCTAGVSTYSSPLGHVKSKVILGPLCKSVG
jgi:hypothetical protein